MAFAAAHDRGQAEVIGVILIFGLVLTGAVVVVVLGSGAISESQDQVSADRAEKTLTQFDSKAALVALGNTDTQEVTLGVNQQSNYEVNEGEGWLRITIEDQEAATTTEVVNQSLGTVTYEINDNTVAYQGGGVWRRAQANESRMVSPPEFYFRNGTLTLPIVNVTGARSLGSDASITREQTITKYPTGGDENPLDNSLVTVTVQSQYYKGWGRYFEERTDGEVEYNHTRNTVTLTLVSPAGQVMLVDGLSAYTAGNLTISGQAGTTCGQTLYFDSYNSSGTTAGYCGQTPGGSDGNISYRGTVDLGGAGASRQIKGTLKSDEWIEFNNDQWTVTEEIVYDTDCRVNMGSANCTDVASGSVIQKSDSIPRPRNALDVTIENVKAEAFASDNDNGTNISSGTLDPGPVTLTSGRYYLDHMRRSEDVQFNVCGGDIEIVVEGDVELTGGPANPVSFEVIEPTCPGTDNRVFIYVNGSSATSDGDGFDFRMSKYTEVTVPEDDAPQFRIFGKKDFRAEVGDGGGGVTGPAEYTGVIYAPTGGDQSADGEVIIDKAIVYGAIVTGDTEVRTLGSVHYDEALKRTQVVPPDAKVLKITYLHVSVNRIHVD